MLVETAAGLHLPPGDFHIDPWQSVPRAAVCLPLVLAPLSARNAVDAAAR